MKSHLPSWLTRAKSPQIGMGILFALLIFLTTFVNVPGASLFINRFDSLIYDQMIRWYHHPYPERGHVVIIDIDDQSIYKEGRWPWPRDKMANLLMKLHDLGVVVAGFDIIMSDPEINYAVGLKDKLNNIVPQFPIDLKNLGEALEKLTPLVDNDQAFAQAMQQNDVVLGFLFQNQQDVRKGALPSPLTDSSGKLLDAKLFSAEHFKGYSASLKLFMDSAHHGGFVTNLPDPDGVVRQGLALSSFDNKVYASLALMTVMRYLLADHVDLKMHDGLNGRTLYGIDVAGTFIPTNAHGQILIPYWGPPFTLPFYSATDILHGNVKANEFQDTVAIVGSSALMLSDLHPAPVAKVFPGVEMVGNMVTAMLGNQIATKYDWSTLTGAILLVIFGLICAFVIPYMGIGIRIIFALVLIGAILGFMGVLFVTKNLYVPAAYMLTIISLQTIGNYVYEFFSERRQKSKMKELFGQYVPESYVKELLDSPESSTMEGRTLNMTVLFSDIRSFTTISEHLDAAGVKRLLNTFFTPITEIIYNSQGTIDKYVGDMVMAFWGAPIPIPNNGHAYHAIKASLDIFKALPSINAIMAENELPSVNIGIGLGTGLMNVGDMGSQFRRAYTVLGDMVNLASRLESLTKYYGVNILVNDETREGQEEFLWRAIDKVAVKGRATSLTIYEPLGLISEVPLERFAEIEKYHHALGAYYEQNWELSESMFTALHAEHPGIRLYELYLARINVFKVSPPQNGWDGVFVHHEK
jgi:adenylate cyclase